MAKLRIFAVYCALLCAVIGLAAGEEQDDSMVEEKAATDTMQPVSEEPIKLIHVLNPGEREYLSPNLIGLQNIAMTFIPLTMNFINVIDAYREIVNGVRYDILLNAIDTKDNNNEIICHLSILEKPWLRTQWGDKVREILSSNCTTNDGPNDSANMDANLNIRNAINDKDSTNTVFNGGSRNELSGDEMAKLESQIIPIPSDGKMKYPTITTTPSSVNPEITSTEDEVEVNKRNDSNEEDTMMTETTTETLSTNDNDDKNQNDNDNENDNGNNDKDNDHNNNENSLTLTSTSTTTTEKPKELTDDEKNWLDNIFSFGAFNFEQQQLQKQQAADNKKSNFESNQLSSSLIRKNEESNYVQPSTDFIMQHNLQHQGQQQQQQQYQQQSQQQQRKQQYHQINDFQHQLQLQEQEQLTNFANDFQQIQPLKIEDYQQQEWQHQQLPNGDYQQEYQAGDYQQQQQLRNYNQEQKIVDYQQDQQQQRQQYEENFKINDGNIKEDHMALSQVITQ